MNKKVLDTHKSEGHDSDQDLSDRFDLDEFKNLLEQGLKSPTTQFQTDQPSENKDVSVPIAKDFLWLPSSKGFGIGYKSRLDRMKQMDLKPNYVVYNMYTPLGSATFAIFLGILLFTLSLVLFFLSSTVKLEISYTENDNGPLTINITKDFKPPIYVYYKISKFYVTHKRVVYDSDPNLVANSSCKTFKTFADILDLRCIDGKNTLNGINEWCENYKDDENFNKPVYPCGPLAATMMTDNFEICPSEVSRNAEGNYDGVDFDSCLDIQIQDQSDLWKFISFNVSKKEYNKGFCWIDLSNPLYHTWLQNPYTNTFLKPYGVIYDEVPAGEYKIHLVNNLWPDQHWEAKKSIYITCVNLFGTKSLPFEILLLCISGLYVVTGLVLLVLHFTGFKVKTSPWRKLKKVTIGIVGEREQLIRRSSTSEIDVEPTQIPQGRGICLCPLH